MKHLTLTIDAAVAAAAATPAAVTSALSIRDEAATARGRQASAEIASLKKEIESLSGLVTMLSPFRAIFRRHLAKGAAGSRLFWEITDPKLAQILAKFDLQLTLLRDSLNPRIDRIAGAAKIFRRMRQVEFADDTTQPPQKRDREAWNKVAPLK